MVAIGIDLGTTYSCVAVVSKDKAECITNDYGKYTTPSVVAFSDDEILVGEAAKSCVFSLQNIIYDAKRFIGKQFNDPQLKADMDLSTFKIVDVEGKPHFEVDQNGRITKIPPEKISSRVLKKLKENAETYLGEQITKAVITVPAYFNQRQKHETMKAAEAAGLKVQRLLNEPTAAALAYGENVEIQNKTILVFDLGGVKDLFRTFDISILKIEGRRTTILTITGHSHLGGEDFDQSLMKYFMDKFEKDRGVKIKEKALRRLKEKVTNAKESLSFTTKNVRVEVDNAGGGEDLNYPLTRDIIDEVCGKMFRGTMYFVDKALKEAKLTTDNIDEVLLVGGSTRLPQIRQLLEAKFGVNKICQRVKPDEAVALGAAIMAYRLEKHENDNDKSASKETEINEVTALSIGCGLRGDFFQPLIPRGTAYPCEASMMIYTTCDDATEVNCPIYEGERARESLNLKLGTVVVNIDPKKRGQEMQIKVKIDENGLLHAKFTEVSTGIYARIKITYDSESKSAIDIHKIIEDAKTFENEDRSFRLLTEQRVAMDNDIYNIKETLENSQGCLSHAIYAVEMQAVMQHIEWINENLLEFELHPRVHKTFKCEMLKRMRQYGLHSTVLAMFEQCLHHVH